MKKTNLTKRSRGKRGVHRGFPPKFNLIEWVWIKTLITILIPASQEKQ